MSDHTGLVLPACLSVCLTVCQVRSALSIVVQLYTGNSLAHQPIRRHWTFTLWTRQTHHQSSSTFLHLTASLYRALLFYAGILLDRIFVLPVRPSVCQLVRMLNPAPNSKTTNRRITIICQNWRNWHVNFEFKRSEVNVSWDCADTSSSVWSAYVSSNVAGEKLHSNMYNQKLIYCRLTISM